MQQPTKHISFGECVKSWSYERFMSTFSIVYPGADLEGYAKSLGLVKPEAEKSSVPANNLGRGNKNKSKP